MTEKRFAYIKNSSISQYQSIPIQKIGKGKSFHCQGVVDELNKLWNENEQLKKEYLKLDHRHGLLHDECLDVECERDSLKKDVEYLEKENEQLKQENKQLTKEFNSCSHNWALMYDEAKNKVEELSKENKELKAKVDDKEVAVEVETCKIMEKVFALIDKSLEKDKQYYEMSYEDYLNGRIEALEELKKELQK